MISAAVLAGGASTRMGRDKALITLKGRTLVEHVVERLRPISDDVFVVTKRPDALEHVDVPVVTDRRDVQTPLAGIATALRTARYGHVFVCACDMPLISTELVHHLSERIGGHDAVVPLRNDRPEPSHALWSKAVADTVDLALATGERAVYRVLETLDAVWIDESEWRTIDPDGASFMNVNTPEDLARLSRTTA